MAEELKLQSNKVVKKSATKAKSTAAKKSGAKTAAKKVAVTKKPAKDVTQLKAETPAAGVIVAENVATKEPTEVKAEKVEVKTINPETKMAENSGKRKKTPWEIVTLVATIVVCVVLLPVLIVNIVLIFKSVIKPNDIPTIFGYKPLIVQSDSMSPLFNRNDLIFSKQVEASSLRAGDVITYREESGAVVTHKIKTITQETDGTYTITTYGINNYQRNADGTPFLNNQNEKVYTIDDEAVKGENVEGVYVSRIAGLGGFLYWMQTVWGMILCIGIPVIGFVVYELLRRNAELNAERATSGAATSELEELRKKLAEMEKAKEEK